MGHARAAALMSAGAFLLAAAALPVQAQSISPSSVTATLGVGESLTINKTITVGEFGATAVDLFFLADNTGSMSDEIANAQSGASAILGALPSTGYRFGVGEYNEDPSEGFYPDAYLQNQALTTDKTLAQTGINAWGASGGGDYPEGNFYALKQVAETAGWRPDAQRLVVWFGDAPSHTATTTQAEAITALQAANAKVVAFNSSVEGLGLDDDGQATAITTATGGSLTHGFNALATSVFVDRVNAAIDEATSSIDLVFGSTFIGSGLELRFACTDPLGCTGVGAGESRTFDLTIEALEVGIYDFEVFAQGIEAVETDRIYVTNGTGEVVPEPATMLLLGTGLLGIGGFAWRRREDEPTA